MMTKGSMQNVPGAKGIDRLHLGDGDLPQMPPGTVANRFGPSSDCRPLHADIFEIIIEIVAAGAAGCAEVG